MENINVVIRTLEGELREFLEDYGIDQIGLGIDSDGVIGWYVLNTHGIGDKKVCNACEEWKEHAKKMNNLKL